MQERTQGRQGADIAGASLVHHRIAQARANRNLQYRDDPVGFIQDRLGEYLWSKQREIAESVRDNPRTVVRSCHASGKSFLAARIIAWWLETSMRYESFCVSTAPTFAQVRAILWRELHRAHASGDLSGTLNQTEWKDDSGELVAMGRKPADYDETAFQGIHAPRVLVVIDEAAGVPPNLWEAAESIATSDASRILAIGNPDDPGSTFARMNAPGSSWHSIHIDGLLTPAFTDEEVPEELYLNLISKGWIDRQRKDYGEDSAFWQARVRGNFPDEAEDTVIPLTFIRRCQNEAVVPIGKIVQLGVDVGAGGDETVIFERVGNKVGRSWGWRTPDSMDAVGKIIGVIGETGATIVKVDVIGIGWAVVGRLGEVLAGKGVTVVGVNTGRKSTRPDRFPRLRDEIWWDARIAMQDMAWNLDELDEQTIGQLVAPKFKHDSMGRRKIESKDDTKKRLGRSPDQADALLLCYYDGNRTAITGGQRDEETRDQRLAGSDENAQTTVMGDPSTMHSGGMISGQRKGSRWK